MGIEYAGSDHLVRLGFDYLQHHLVDAANHVLGVALQPRLQAGVVKQLADYQTCLISVFFAELVQLNDQLVFLVVLESYVL